MNHARNDIARQGPGRRGLGPVGHWSRLCAAAALTLTLGLALPAAAQQRITELDRIVAVINNDVVAMSELAAKVDTIREELRQRRVPPPPESVLLQQVLDKLIVHRLQLQEAERTGIRVDDDTLNRALAEIAKANRMQLADFRRALENDGFSYARFREDMRDEIKINRLRQREVAQKIAVSEQEITLLLANEAQNTETAATEYRVGHILLGVPENAGQEAAQKQKQRAEQLVAELRKGADFRQAAQQYSQAQTALEGGDLGFRKLAQLPPPLAQAVSRLKPGDVSEPLRLPGGWHILKLLETRGGGAGGPQVVEQSLTRHILIRISDAIPEADAQEKIRKLHERATHGEDFAALARANSQDPGSAANGGLLNWVSPGEMVAEFERVMQATAPGQISAPFRSEFGWHILKVEDRRQHDASSETRRAQARETIRKRKVEEETEIWLRRLRDEAYIENRLNPPAPARP